MKPQKTWPSESNTPRLTALSFTGKDSNRHRHYRHSSSKSNTSGTTRKSTSFSSKTHVSKSLNHQHYDYSSLPYELVQKIASSFSLPNLLSASLVCHAWRDALQPLREAIVFLRWGKRYKHGRGGLRPDVDKALEFFLKGVAHGSTPSMVDAGLIYWEMGKKEKGIALYTRAAELGDPNGQCNLGISYLQADPPCYKEAVKWLYKASFAGHVRAQYQLALCKHQGRGVDQNLHEAARWYQQAAEGGYARAMYNTSLCYSFGKGLVQCRRLAREWMKRAADRGHSKAQLEHGLLLFSEGEMMKAVVYLELATRAGESAAIPVRNVILQGMSTNTRDRVLQLADNWRPLPSSR